MSSEPLFSYAPPPDGFDATPYPPSEWSDSPRPVWALGEPDETTSVMAAGHDPVSAYALREYRTHLIGRPPTDAWRETANVEPAWVLIHTECGCTEEQHTAHRQLADTDDGAPCPDGCTHPGLPPCMDPDDLYAYAWVAVDATEGTPGALPVVRTVREEVHRG
jgi:hypothetical protein